VVGGIARCGLSSVNDTISLKNRGKQRAKAMAMARLTVRDEMRPAGLPTLKLSFLSKLSVKLGLLRENKDQTRY